jgi:transposase
MRTFDVEISGNRRRGQQFSPEAKGAMLGMLRAGASLRAVAREFKTTHSTVSKLRNRFKDDHTTDYKARKGRPSVLTKAEKRYIIRLASKDRSITWSALVGSVDT